MPESKWLDKSRARVLRLGPALRRTLGQLEGTVALTHTSFCSGPGQGKQQRAPGLGLPYPFLPGEPWVLCWVCHHPHPALGWKVLKAAGAGGEAEASVLSSALPSSLSPAARAVFPLLACFQEDECPSKDLKQERNGWHWGHLAWEVDSREGWESSQMT